MKNWFSIQSYKILSLAVGDFIFIVLKILYLKIHMKVCNINKKKSIKDLN